jgi:hypothetical protein
MSKSSRCSSVRGMIVRVLLVVLFTSQIVGLVSVVSSQSASAELVSTGIDSNAAPLEKVKDLSHCSEASYLAKTFHPTKNSRKVPLLLGMPNSGVIWMRDIVEQFTGKYTGSVGKQYLGNY